MKYRFIIVFCIIIGGCSMHTVEVAVPGPGYKVEYGESLWVDMFGLGYFPDCMKSTIDEFCRLNPRYFKLTDFTDENNPNFVKSGPGWYLMKSSTSGKVYKYLINPGDVIIIPRSLRDHATHIHTFRAVWHGRSSDIPKGLLIHEN